MPSDETSTPDPARTLDLARRYDIKAHALVRACQDAAVILQGPTENGGDTITLRAEDWSALTEHLARELLPGDLMLYARQHPGIVLARATKLLQDREWMSRAREEAAKS